MKPNNISTIVYILLLITVLFITSQVFSKIIVSVKDPSDQLGNLFSLWRNQLPQPGPNPTGGIVNMCGTSGCNSGESGFRVFTLSQASSEIAELVNLAREKQRELEQWLNSQQCEGGCPKDEFGPDVSIHVEPLNIYIGSCQNPHTSLFTLTATEESYSCAGAEAEVLESLLSQAQSLAITGNDDPCPTCSYYWRFYDLNIRCTGVVSIGLFGKRYGATGSMKVERRCGDLRSDSWYRGWISWSACFSCGEIPSIPRPPSTGTQNETY